MDLRANTAVDVLIGPFLDSTDGDTEESALTISQADVQLSKNGQALAQKNDVTAAAFDAKAMYNCELDATDLNTEGNLVLVVHESGALYVRHEYNVLSEAAFDSLYAPKDTGFMDINLNTMGDSAQSVTDLKDFADDGYDPATNSVEQVKVNDDVAALNDFDPANDDVAVVTLVGTVSVNTDTAATLGTPANIDSGGATIADNLKKLADNNDGADFSAATDSQEAIRNRGDAAWTTGAGGSDPQTLISTTIATLATQVSFTLTAGSTDDNAYNKAVAVITDVSTSVQKAFMDIEDYDGGTKTVTLRADPGIFTMAATDIVDIIVGVTAEQLVAEHFAHITEGTETFEEQQRLIRSATVAKLGISGNDNSFRDAVDSKDRIVSTTNANGERTTVVVDGS